MFLSSKTSISFLNRVIPCKKIACIPGFKIIRCKQHFLFFKYIVAALGDNVVERNALYSLFNTMESFASSPLNKCSSSFKEGAEEIMRDISAAKSVNTILREKKIYKQY